MIFREGAAGGRASKLGRRGATALLAAVMMAGATAAQAAYIVVDTGHTPQHSGAISASGRAEYAYNLDLSGAVAHDLMALDDRVTRIAVNGKEIALKDRTGQAPEADFFISIHHDSIQQSWIDAGRQREFAGFSIFVSQLNPHYERSLQCARAIGEGLLAVGEKPSLYHATTIQGENRPLLDQRLGIHRFDDLVVLKTARMPAVLVEAGVIVNPDEDKRLSDPQTITAMANAIAQAVHECNEKP